jgi:S-adenosyl methyltransferase
MPELPPEIDTSRPHSARVYDYMIGGKNNFAADRETAAQVLKHSPNAHTAARENRAFLGRAVRFLTAEAGIRQFLDIGTGLPTTNSVHEVAQSIDPTCRVVYCDNDPLVLAHARALLTSSREGRTAYIQADARDPKAILSNQDVRAVLDFDQPIALMLVALLHGIADEDNPAEIVATLVEALPSGSYLVASHLTMEHDTDPGASQRVLQGAGVPMQKRASDDFARLAFAGLDLVPPGVVLVSEWRRSASGPHPSPAEVNCYGGVARKQYDSEYVGPTP